jgi:hypothetical protein
VARRRWAAPSAQIEKSNPKVAMLLALSQRAHARANAAPVAPRAAAPRAAVRVAPRRRRRRLADAARASAAAASNAASAAAPLAAGAPLPEAVDRLLALVAGGEDAMPPAARAEADALIARLEAAGAPRPLENPLIFGDYVVAYVSVGNRQLGAPAGGAFRGTLGRALFSTRLLAQSVLKPDVVTNYVGFALLGGIPGGVGLRGRLVSVPESPGGADDAATAKVFFDAPVLSLNVLGGLHARIGPPSTVVLTTTYLDERVRLGRGSRGSRFVFARGGAAAEAGMDRVGLERTSRAGKAAVAAALAALVGGGAWAASRPAVPVPVRALGVVAAALGLALGGVVARGG